MFVGHVGDHRTMDRKQISTVTIQCALDREAAPIRAALEGRQELALLGNHVWTGTYAGMNLAVCVGGMGVANSASCAQFLIDRFNPQAVIFSGIAGSINSNLAIGDLLIGAEQHYAETNTAIIAECPPYLEYFPADSDLLQAATSAAEALGYQRAESVGDLVASGRWRGRDARPAPVVEPGGERSGQEAHFVVGNISTSDRFNTAPEVLDELVTRFRADGEAMEEASAAQVCGKCAVPFLCVRGISNPCGQAYDDLNSHEADMDMAADAAARVALKTVSLLNPQG